MLAKSKWFDFNRCSNIFVSVLQKTIYYVVKWMGSILIQSLWNIDNWTGLSIRVDLDLQDFLVFVTIQSASVNGEAFEMT